MQTCSKERVQNKIETFAQFGDTGNGGITRFSLSKEALQAREEFVKRMEALSAEIVTDDMANMYATIQGTEANLPRIVIASHVDSVRNGGNYDGILGVITAMEVVETIVTEKIPHRYPITAMIWTNEEGSLYPPAMMSSGVVCGKFDKAKMLASKSAEGKTFGEALEESGYIGDEINRLNPKDYRAMLELHIEQGPVLEAEEKQIGVVEGVVGMVNYRIRTYGQSDHAGTTPMQYRRDALLAAASAIKYLHRELDKLDSNLVYTTGEILCHPNVHTVIPDFIDFSLDARHKDPEVIKQVVEVIKNMPKEFDKCQVKYEEAWARNTVDFNDELVGFVQKSADAYGYSSKKMYSGAGHDAQYVADMMPTAMVFVPSKDGHSHCEPEYTSVEECWRGINVVLQTVLEIDKK
ncbi:N-carbamoyl-L-amino-acid hydrolase [Natronincola peptidivorans]|uniref:N-carbamoyl-L-amino-acid hydrolase n=1 Tax=Natronincola peptidivorans TaxID=426128 RepID=A0A1I0FNR5_9FIRM|nr:Zn-dependent hydrolase [Natronincola peptidivorans]SET59987.1 N-carbamoyl-L-amino-acid hydrolase [Natronincola peptidivorans]